MYYKFIPNQSLTFTTSILFLLSLCSIICGKIPIQAHSFNDLNYMSNLMHRGIDVFKIDISMANKKSCEQYSTWNHSNLCYKSNQFIQQVCCLAIRGDTSAMLSFSYPFNTSQQFITFLDNQLTNIIVNQPNRKIIIAIDFQYRFSFDDYITEGFLLALANVLLEYPKNLLVGISDNFILQYDRICYGKGAPQCTQTRRKISKSNIFLQASSMNPFDPRDYYKRFRNFNAFYEGVSHYCKNGFPDWINNYPQFPLIFWEPSSETQIQYVINQFLKPQCVKKHGRNISGLAIASNLDPQMLDFYSRKIVQTTEIKKSFNPKTQKLYVSEQTNVRLTKIRKGSSQIVYSVSQNVIITNKLLIQKWEYDAKTETFKLTNSRQFAMLLSESENIVNLLRDEIGHLVLVTLNDKSTDKPNKIYYFEPQTMSLVSFADWVKMEAVCMKGNELVYINCDKQYNSCSIKGAIELKPTSTNITFTVKILLSKITSMEITENGFIIVGNNKENKYLSSAAIIRDGRLVPPLVPLSYGHNPKLIRKQTGKQYGVLLQNAMCHCGTLINNNGMNKCSAYKQPQLQSLRSIRGLINLMQFNLQDLLKNQQIVSPCHPKISLTKLMNGMNTDIIQLLSIGSYMISSQYLRIEDQDVMSSLFCGPSNFDKQYKYKLKSSMIGTFYLTNQVKGNGNYGGEINLLKNE